MKVPRNGPLEYKKVSGFPPNKFVRTRQDRVTKFMSSSDYQCEDGAMLGGGYSRILAVSGE